MNNQNQIDQYTIPGMVVALIVTFLATYGAQALVSGIGRLF